MNILKMGDGCIDNCKRTAIELNKKSQFTCLHFHQIHLKKTIGESESNVCVIKQWPYHRSSAQLMLAAPGEHLDI